MTGVPAAVRLGRMIRTVRIVKMNPKKEGPVGMQIQPRENAIHSGVAAALKQRGAVACPCRDIGGIVIDFETTAEPPHGVKDKRTDEGRCLVTEPPRISASVGTAATRPVEVRSRTPLNIG